MLYLLSALYINIILLIIIINTVAIKDPYPMYWRTFDFGNNNPICLELGMGRGSFIIEMSKKYPKINFIGLELDKDVVNKKIDNIMTDFEKQYFKEKRQIYYVDASFKN